MTSRRLLSTTVAFLVIWAAGCGPAVDLQTALDVTDVISGWYDNGIKDGKNHLVPSITFRLHNKGSVAFGNVQLTVSFWRVGDDGEMDSAQVSGIGNRELRPGASTDPITVRSTVGFTLEQPRAELFTHSLFRDAIVKIFARHSGHIVAIGEFKVDHQIIPRAHTGAGQP